MTMRSAHLDVRIGPPLAATALALLSGCAAPPAAEDPPGEPPAARITLGSGLTIEDTRLGAGEPVVPGSIITVRYTASLADGTVVDGTADGEPRVFPLSRMIEGWRQGLIGMRTGGVRRLLVPADLAYGRAGCPPLNIPPDADLVFQVELLSVRPASGG